MRDRHVLRGCDSAKRFVTSTLLQTDIRMRHCFHCCSVCDAWSGELSVETGSHATCPKISKMEYDVPADRRMKKVFADYVMSLFLGSTLKPMFFWYVSTTVFQRNQHVDRSITDLHTGT
jgi:hypothetical protein